MRIKCRKEDCPRTFISKKAECAHQRLHKGFHYEREIILDLTEVSLGGEGNSDLWADFPGRVEVERMILAHLGYCIKVTVSRQRNRP